MKNPHQICTWDDDAECETCKVNGMLQCHEDYHYSIWFGSAFLSFAIPVFWGIFNLRSINTTLFLSAILSYVVYLIVFFLLWEPQMLCSHCPYYAEGDTKILHCYANHGFIKTAKYKPGPMNTFEKVQFIIGVLLFIILPYPFLLKGEQYIFLIFATLGFIFWVIVLQTKICTDCVNFSCPLNRVPKNIRDEFISKNPVIKEAWEKKGYTFES